MPRYVIERAIPAIGTAEREALRDAAHKSNTVLAEMKAERKHMALWYSPECKIIVLSNTYLNISTFQHPEKRVQRCARPLRFHSTSPM